VIAGRITQSEEDCSVTVGANAPEKLRVTKSPALLVVWYVLSSGDNEESLRKVQRPVNGRVVSSTVVVEKVTLNQEKSVSGVRGARRLDIEEHTSVMWS